MTSRRFGYAFFNCCGLTRLRTGSGLQTILPSVLQLRHITWALWDNI